MADILAIHIAFKDKRGWSPDMEEDAAVYSCGFVWNIRARR